MTGGEMEKVIVSVIVPIYNVENYLEKCLEQLAKQTLKDIEVIMVDDGSTDNSSEIAKRYEEKYSHFKLVRKTNGGLSSARNFGMKYAMGKYLYFCDSDDYIFDNTLELLTCKAEEQQLDVVKFCAYEFNDSDEDNLWIKAYKYNGDYKEVTTGKQLLKEMYEHVDNIPSACLSLIRRSVISDNDIRFIEGIIHEDNLFNFQILYFSDKVLLLKEYLYCRRYRRGSIVQSIDYYKTFEGYARTAIEIDKLVKNDRTEYKWAKRYVQMYVYFALSRLQMLNELPIDKNFKEMAGNIKAVIIRNLFWADVRLFIFTVNVKVYLTIWKFFSKIEKEKA